MKIKKSLYVLFVILVLLSGCKGVSKELQLGVCGSYAVPGMSCTDLKGENYTYEVLEEDSRGRVLYTYVTKNVVSGSKETALIICQHTDGEYVYFYEDVCFLIGDYNEEDIEQIKERNDWDKALDYDKMTKREVLVSVDLCLVKENTLDYKRIKTECSEVLEVDTSQMQEFCICDVNEKGYELYFLVLQTKEELQKYWVICDLEYNIYVALVDEDLNSIEALIELKKESGWY